MPFYEIFSSNSGRTLGVYEYSDEISLRKFMRLLPNFTRLLYHELEEKDAKKVRREIRKENKKRLDKIMFELWGRGILEE